MFAMNVNLHLQDVVDFKNSIVKYVISDTYQGLKIRDDKNDVEVFIFLGNETREMLIDALDAPNV